MQREVPPDSLNGCCFRNVGSSRVKLGRNRPRLLQEIITALSRQMLSPLGNRTVTLANPTCALPTHSLYTSHVHSPHVSSFDFIFQWVTKTRKSLVCYSDYIVVISLAPDYFRGLYKSATKNQKLNSDFELVAGWFNS